MRNSPDDLLEHCLAGRAAGQSIEACLRSLDDKHPHDFEPLMGVADALRATPRPGLSAAARADHERLLLTRTAQLRGERRLSPVPSLPRTPWSAFFRWRLGLVPATTIFLLVVSLVLMSSAGTMVSNARPEDAFYHIKLSWEQTRLLIATNDAQRARLSLEIAQHRLQELESLALDGRPIPEDLLLQIKQSISQAIALTRQQTAREAIPLLRDISELLTYERILLARFLDGLPESDRLTVELALREVVDSQRQVTQTLEELVEEQVPAQTSTTPATSTPAGSSERSEIKASSPERSALPPPYAASTVIPLVEMTSTPAPIETAIENASYPDNKPRQQRRDRKADQSGSGDDNLDNEAERETNASGKSVEDSTPARSRARDETPGRSGEAPGKTRLAASESNRQAGAGPRFESMGQDQGGAGNSGAEPGGSGDRSDSDDQKVRLLKP